MPPSAFDLALPRDERAVERRGRGILGALLDAATAHAKARGATVLEAYPVDEDSPSYRFGGFLPSFEDAGFVEIGRGGTRWHVVRRKLRRCAPVRVSTMERRAPDGWPFGAPRQDRAGSAAGHVGSPDRGIRRLMQLAASRAAACSSAASLRPEGPSVGLRADTDDVPKACAQDRGRAKACSLGDLLHRQAGHLQQPLRLAQASSGHPPPRRRTGLLTESSAEGAAAESGSTCEGAKGEIATEVLFNPGQQRSERSPFRRRSLVLDELRLPPPCVRVA